MRKENCTVYQTPFYMYYSGNATAEYIHSFALGLQGAIKRKLDDDKYREIVTVHTAYIDDSSLGLIPPKTFVRNLPVGAIVGIAIGGLAPVVGVIGFLYLRKRTGSIIPFSKE
mmetsp:Transcript_14991/g.17219  ORF Transcript_14991/g.17219 Transcript_14991/m.17219 type:complete len:113 (+) Transcript_14991:516-854(+)